MHWIESGLDDAWGMGVALICKVQSCRIRTEHDLPLNYGPIEDIRLLVAKSR